MQRERGLLLADRIIRCNCRGSVCVWGGGWGGGGDAWQQGSRPQDRQVDKLKTASDGEFCLNRLTAHLRDVDKVVMLGPFFKKNSDLVLHPAVLRLLDVGQVTVNDLVF